MRFHVQFAAAVLAVLSLAARSYAQPAQSDAMAFARGMGVGWNLGNTLEATGSRAKTVREFETSWGEPVATKELFAGIRAAGFRSVRIPVSWSNLMAADYTISPDLMNRVEEVVNYALASDLRVMINVHWDGGWIKGFSTDPDRTMAKYRAIWTQVAKRFADYDDRLIFESMNEEGHFDDIWNRYGGPAERRPKAFDILNGVNQAFVDLVRKSGGKNATRYLLLAGYATDVALTADPLFKVPEDPAGHCMVSVHYYDPPAFAILEKDADWGKARYTWGTPEDVEAVRNDLLKVKRRFVDAGVPVVVGEFGCPSTKEPASVRKYLTTVCETAYSLGLVPMLWDTGGVYDRRNLRFNDPELAKDFARIMASDRP